MAVDLGRTGIWTFNLDLVGASEGAEIVGELEALGFGAVWVPEAVGREAFTNAALLLGGGEHIVVATGVASMWLRHPMAASAAQKALTEAHPNRFVLGLGVSHAAMVDGVLGESYTRPLGAMRDYVDRMDASLFMAKPPPASSPPTRVLAALGPKMLELAAQRFDGAHTYNVSPTHTADARQILGEGPVLAVEQAVVLVDDAQKARELGRRHLATYLGLPNYSNNWLREGMAPSDLADGGSERLVDHLVAWGGIDAILARVEEHRAAGADHVCVQVIADDPTGIPMAEWRELAAALC